ncbi:MAG: DUF502 domain-containing protein [Paracoccaceae bacterium]|jgi:uncharacterized membrane protein|nr:hypothetical protein [Marinovum sp.]PDH59047.1 MAG: hypothetical protein CNE94_02325 [Rhodobacteraceae bacterium MED-G07]|tara:strand:+ start:134 stop:835 length:702 start_codon:yes stop_codon:yes gene_type:complete
MSDDKFIDPKILPKPQSGLIAGFRNSFLTGLVVIAPVALTIWLIWSVIGWIDGFVLPFIPNLYHPDNILNTFFGQDVAINIRGLGVVVFLLFTTFVGWIAKGFLGRSLIRIGENLVRRMPVVRSIYSGVKQIAETVFAQSDRSFEKACLIEYPRKGIWAVGFVSTEAKGEVKYKAKSNSDLLSVFVPTTPNPTSGFMLFFPRNDVIELEMSIEDAAKLVISAGLVYPPYEIPK